MWKKGDSVSQKKAFSGERKLTGDSVVIIEKGEKCRSLKTFSGGRKSAGAEVPVVRRSVSVNVTDAVTQSITDDVAMSRVQTIQGVLRVWKRQLQRDRVLLLGPRGCLSSE